MNVYKGMGALLFALFFGLALAEAGQKEPSSWVKEKSAENKMYVLILKALDSMALKNDALNLSKPDIERVDNLLEGLESSEHLYKLATITKTLFNPGKPEHQNYDAIYENVFWMCARKLVERTDDESIWYLAELKRIFGTDGGDSLMLSELVERQKKTVLEKAKGNPKPKVMGH